MDINPLIITIYGQHTLHAPHVARKVIRPRPNSLQDAVRVLVKDSGLGLGPVQTAYKMDAAIRVNTALSALRWRESALKWHESALK